MDNAELERNRFQRVGAISNTHAGREFEDAVQLHLESRGHVLERDFGVEVGHHTSKLHRFDLGSREPPMLVECKSYTWTKGGNSPSAKIRGLNEAMLIFSVAPADYRKMLYMMRHMRGDVSLARHYLKNQGHLIPVGVEVWEFDVDALGATRLH